MDAIDALLNRRSVRAYSPDHVPQEVIDQIVQCGLYAPSGMDRQDPIVVQVADPELRDQIAHMNAEIAGMPDGSDPFYGAPDMLIVLAPKDVPNHVYDGSLVMGNLMNAAYALGVSTCWIHRAREEFETPWGRELLASLGIEGDYEGIGHVALGYAAEPAPAAKPRRDGRAYRIA